MLEKIEAAYAQEFGIAPFNISHWDPTDDFETAMLPHLELPPLRTTIAYRFSYQVTETEAVLDKLGTSPETHFGIFTPSTTTSILCVLNWLKSRRRERIVAVCPAYFSLFHACRRFGLTIRATYLRRSQGRYALPHSASSIWRERGVLWLTNPVYGAGVYLTEDDIKFIDRLLTNGWTVIADECLALPGRELIRKLGHHPEFLAIYSPHKGVCVNGMKFSAVVFGTKYQAFMERWADVWYGGLGSSNSLALTHYLSENFDRYAAAFLATVALQRASFNSFTRDAAVETDPTAEGHFVSCYFQGVPSRLGMSGVFLRDLVYRTGGSIITGNRSRFHHSFGLSFRVNLARGGPRFGPTLKRLIQHLQAQAG